MNPVPKFDSVEVLQSNKNNNLLDFKSLPYFIETRMWETICIFKQVLYCLVQKLMSLHNLISLINKAYAEKIETCSFNY